MSKELEEYPDAQLHKIISLFKSGIRIGGCLGVVVFAGSTGSIIGLAVSLLIAEGLGIVEELV